MHTLTFDGQPRICRCIGISMPLRTTRLLRLYMKASSGHQAILSVKAVHLPLHVRMCYILFVCFFSGLSFYMHCVHVLRLEHEGNTCESSVWSKTELTELKFSRGRKTQSYELWVEQVISEIFSTKKTKPLNKGELSPQQYLTPRVSVQRKMKDVQSTQSGKRQITVHGKWCENFSFMKRGSVKK